MSLASDLIVNCGGTPAEVGKIDALATYTPGAPQTSACDSLFELMLPTPLASVEGEVNFARARREVHACELAHTTPHCVDVVPVRSW